MAVDLVLSQGQDRIEHRFRAPVHLLVVYEQGKRRDGETFVEGLPRSGLRDLEKKLAFVPAGHEYREWSEPRNGTSIIYFYMSPDRMRAASRMGAADAVHIPKLFFEDAAIWHTALKLKRSIETMSSGDGHYAEALGVVLLHELPRLFRKTQAPDEQIRGGLAGWQQRVVTSYIEQHLDEPVSLAELAELARLSLFHFCRAFKKSFGVPPHRYHTHRRVEHAKALLAQQALSVTEIGLAVGFSETSSFSAAFRKATGLTPTGYRRSLS